MTEEIEPRFTGWRRRINVNRLCEGREPIGLQVIWRKRTKVYRLDEKREPRLTG